MSTTFQVQREFNVPVQKLYESLLDLEAAEQWMQGLIGINRMDEGSMQVGSQWKETRKMFGKQASEHFEVIELIKPDKIVLRCDGTKGTTGKGEFLFTYTLTPTDEHTALSLHGEINGLTGPAKWFGKLMAGSFKKACAKDLDALKKYLENR